MIDRQTTALIRPAIDAHARRLVRAGVGANALTLTALGIGWLAAAATALQAPLAGAVLIGVSRLCDGLDGAVARQTTPTDHGRGGFLDTGLDFLCYPAIPLAFGFADPARNALAAAMLIAVGRAARVRGFGLAELGVECGKTVATNAFLPTTFPNICAAGDVAGPYRLTHTASQPAGCATVNARFDPFKKFRVDEHVIPSASFVEPEVARAGPNEQAARAKKLAIAVTSDPLAELDRAIADGATRGCVGAADV